MLFWWFCYVWPFTNLRCIFEISAFSLLLESKFQWFEILVGCRCGSTSGDLCNLVVLDSLKNQTKVPWFFSHGCGSKPEVPF